MTLDEKIGLLHGIWATPVKNVRPPAAAVGGAGYVPGVGRLGLPALQESDAGLGIANPDDVRPGDEATALPSGLAMAASFDTALNRRAGAMIGDEASRKGFNVLLGGGANLIRDPRGGRSFEYASEDPLLTGRVTGAQIAGVQTQPVMATMKHFAMNDQESGVFNVDARIGPGAMRQSDLLAFEIALEEGRPGAVMCAYNRVNGVPACQNEALLTRTLRHDWHFPGFVMSDWGAVHDTTGSVRAGLDQESGEQFDRIVYYGDALKQAVLRGAMPVQQIDRMVGRILSSEITQGLLDVPPRRGQPIDIAAHAAIAEQVEDAGIVLLHNPHGLLPLSRNIRRILLVGGHADQGVLSGGGSPQVIPYGGAIVTTDGPKAFPGPVRFDPSSPMAAMRQDAPGAEISYLDGRDRKPAVDAAKAADVAVVFATQWMVEGQDGSSLALPGEQDRLIAAVAAANPRTIVVLETGDPVSMPWIRRTAAVIEAWYPGSRGGKAIADVLFGGVNPSGRLPVSFPDRLSQLPRPVIAGHATSANVALTELPASAPFPVDYDIEGSDVGYRWFERTRRGLLFAFGYGLSYTHFTASKLEVHASGSKVRAEFDLRNDGDRAGTDTPQLYVRPPDARAARLVGWQRVSIGAGRSVHLTIVAEPRLLAHFDVAEDVWRITPGSYRVELAEQADVTHPPRGLTKYIRLAGSTLPP